MRYSDERRVLHGGPISSRRHRDAPTAVYAPSTLQPRGGAVGLPSGGADQGEIGEDLVGGVFELLHAGPCPPLTLGSSRRENDWCGTITTPMAQGPLT